MKEKEPKMRPIDGKDLADTLLGEIFDRGQESARYEEMREIGAMTYREEEWMDGFDEGLNYVYRMIENAPTITLKDYAESEGYALIKKKPMPKLKPCPQCGASGRKIEKWVCQTGYFYICSECNHQSNPARSERKARENWNEIG